MVRIINFITKEFSMEKHYKNHIKTILSHLHPSEQIALIESLGKELRRKNSIRIAKNLPTHLIELERPDLENLKAKK